MPTTSMPRMPAYITGVLILQHNAATIELQQCHMPSIELQQCHGHKSMPAYITGVLILTTIELNYNNAMDDKSMLAQLLLY